MLSQTARVRRLAARVLLVWLFALASGLVNACVIAPQLYSFKSEQRQAPKSDAVSGATTQVEHAGCPDCPDEGTTSVSPGPCGKFCLDEASSVPTAKLALDPGPALGIALVPTMALSVAEAGPRLVPRLDASPPPKARVPVPIAFLRLAL